MVSRLPVAYRRWSSSGLPNAPDPVAPDSPPPTDIIVTNDGTSENKDMPPLTDSQRADLAPKRKRKGLPQLENRNLLILELPTRKKKVRKTPQVEVAEEEVLSLSSYLLLFEQQADAYELAIDMMRPQGSETMPSTSGKTSHDSGKIVVSRARYGQIKEQLDTQFNKPQIHSYVTNIHMAESMRAVHKATSKRDLISHILKTLWKVEISEEISERVDLIVHKKLQMSKEDIFFLIGPSK